MSSQPIIYISDSLSDCPMNLSHERKKLLIISLHQVLSDIFFNFLGVYM